MIKFMLIALMACSGGHDVAPAEAPAATPATELSVTVEAPAADAPAATEAAVETVDATTTTTESTDTTSAK